MKLGLRIVFAVMIVFASGFYYLTHDVLENVRTQYLEGVEESLVDQSRILASMIALSMEQKEFSPEKLSTAFSDTYKRNFQSRIYKLDKTAVDMRVYITDEKGILIFDSQKKDPPGTDYSMWRDVYLTLKGKYGARSTRDNEYRENSSVLYVAAPITVNGKTSGVLTVAKPTTNIHNFLVLAKKRIKKKSLIAAAFVLVAGIAMVLWITRPIHLLTKYAHDIREGKKSPLPRLDKSEIGDMGRAFEGMREALENRKYVEHYVQTLTHEIKSPVAAIRGAAELLEEDMPRETRKQFTGNILGESLRIQKLVDRMLKLSAIENMKELKEKKKIQVSNLVNEVTKPMEHLWFTREITICKKLPEDLELLADPFLIKQALTNLLQNAAEFSPEKGTINISAGKKDRCIFLTVEDQGPGIPDYAISRVFDKFYSLPRPETKNKSTGLGLNFVREIASLHKGSITLENKDTGGARAIINIPDKPHK